jgi:signal peptidase I
MNTNKTTKKESWEKFIFDVIVMTTITLEIFFLLLRLVISNDRVSGASMQPNFEDNDRLGYMAQLFT